MENEEFSLDEVSPKNVPAPYIPHSTPVRAGRPSIYNKELAEEICVQIATTLEPLTVILANLQIGMTTFFNWRVKNAEFRELYACAKEFQQELEAEELRKIAYETPPEKNDMAWVQSQRNKIDVLKWLMSKRAPKDFGDNKKIDVEVSQKQNVTEDQMSTIVSAIMTRNKTEHNNERYEDAEEL